MPPCSPPIQGGISQVWASRAPRVFALAIGVTVANTSWRDSLIRRPATLYAGHSPALTRRRTVSLEMFNRTAICSIESRSSGTGDGLVTDVVTQHTPFQGTERRFRFVLCVNGAGLTLASERAILQ
jgi:hypothetical protein